MITDTWSKSSFSGPNCDNCVEVRRGEDDSVLVRDTKLGLDSPVLRFTAPEWSAFLDGVRNKEFDLP